MEWRSGGGGVCGGGGHQPHAHMCIRCMCAWLLHGYAELVGEQRSSQASPRAPARPAQQPAQHTCTNMHSRTQGRPQARPQTCTHTGTHMHKNTSTRRTLSTAAEVESSSSGCHCHCLVNLPKVLLNADGSLRFEATGADHFKPDHFSPSLVVRQPLVSRGAAWASCRLSLPDWVAPADSC